MKIVRKFIALSIGILIVLSSLPATQDSIRSSVNLTAGSGLYFTDYTCLNNWLINYNYPTLPSGSGSGTLGLIWDISDRWATGIQLNSSASGVSKKSGYAVSYQSSALDFMLMFKIIQNTYFTLGPVGSIEFRTIGVSLERALSSQASMNDLFSQSNGFSQNTGARLRNSARNLGAGIQIETNRKETRTQIGVRTMASGGSKSRWEVNEQILFDSPRNGIRGIQVLAFIKFRL